MNLESPKKDIPKSQEETYDFLTDIRNFEKLMPEDTSKFEVLSENRFVFALKGMPEIVLDLKEKKPYNEIIYGAASEKVPFTLSAQIRPVDAKNSEVQLYFSGEFNSMMAMMIKRPISKFMEALVTNLQQA